MGIIDVVLQLIKENKGMVTFYLFLIILLMYLTKHETNNQKDIKTDLSNTIISLTEEAYFEGQRDAINGDIRIEKNSDGVYYWKKSCWNDGTEPIFKPTYLQSHSE